jgi:1-acyl-sn-glycerol-3-phosphate acyltransferase
MTGTLLFRLLKFPSRLALPLYTRTLVADKKRLYGLKGPLLLAVNHPNSFLDAIILSTLIEQPVHALARGDAFRKPWADRMLRLLNMLPVFRLREGAEHLHHNYNTFDVCRDIFQRNGIVLIFSEGRCVNEWKLRPLMKGTARLSLTSWEAGIPLTVLPIGINYDSFDRFGKTVEIRIGAPITKSMMDNTEPNGSNILFFNAMLEQQLSQLVFSSSDTASIKAHFESLQENVSAPNRLFFQMGKWLHLPLYIPVKHLAKRNPLWREHYDSVVVGLLFLLYPLYLLLIALALHACIGFIGFIIPWIILPLLARFVVKHLE